MPVHLPDLNESGDDGILPLAIASFESRDD
jgi:hypothetical protein